MNMTDFEDDDDIPSLSSETFMALQEFYEEQEARNKLVLKGKEHVHQNIVDEDWQLSQFWYDDNTINSLEMVAKQSVPLNGTVALISCPTLYTKMKNGGHFSEVSLYEYDRRFAIYGDDFQYYDYNSPTSISKDKERYYDLVIADPPFLSEECLEKFAVTIKFLAKSWIILCTGTVMAKSAESLLGLKKCKFKPSHKNNLGNDFSCYSNYDIDVLITK